MSGVAGVRLGSQLLCGGWLPGEFRRTNGLRTRTAYCDFLIWLDVSHGTNVHGQVGGVESGESAVLGSQFGNREEAEKGSSRCLLWVTRVVDSLEISFA